MGLPFSLDKSRAKSSCDFCTKLKNLYNTSARLKTGTFAHSFCPRTAAAIKKEAGTIPFIVEFTFGEYGYEDDGRNTCGGLMLSFTAFGEK